MNKEELFYEAESKTARPHKYSIKYKQKNETIYPSMVIRSQAEAIELLEKENKELKQKAELGEHYKHLYSEVKKQKDDVVEYIKNNTYFEDNIVKTMVFGDFSKDLLRMLGEINE